MICLMFEHEDITASVMRIDSGGQGQTQEEQRVVPGVTGQELMVAWSGEEAMIAIHSSGAILILPLQTPGSKRPVHLRNKGV